MSANANIRAGRAYVEVTAEASKLKQNLNPPFHVRPLFRKFLQRNMA